jgi:hypothetical protein
MVQGARGDGETPAVGDRLVGEKERGEAWKGFRATSG